MQVPLHLTIRDTLIKSTVSLNTSAFTEHIFNRTCWRCDFSFFSLRLCWRQVIQARWKDHLIMFMIIFEHLWKKIGYFHHLVSQYLSPSNSQRRSQCQMLVNDRQRSKLVMDTFIDWALDLPDYDVCSLATVSHQISGRCQLKSARIISQTGSPPCTGSRAADIAGLWTIARRHWSCSMFPTDRFLNGIPNHFVFFFNMWYYSAAPADKWKSSMLSYMRVLIRLNTEPWYHIE